jgi:ribonuclease HII
MLDYAYENSLQGPVAGLDEAGRGPLAGPVTAAAVILDPADVPAGLNDSKRLSPKRRARLAAEIQNRAAAWAVAHACPGQIARLNVIGAAFAAMGRAVAELGTRPRLLLVDGPPQRLHQHSLNVTARFIVGGDGRIASIAAAGILAKVYRDRLMVRLDKLYPGYGFAANKGYGTQALEALRRLGPCPAHRWSWRAVQQTELFG